jgi:hypothetical protein
MEFQLQNRAVKGTLVVSLNTVTRAFHIRPSLDRSTMPALSPPPPPPPLSPLTFATLSPLAFTALSPLQPCSSPAPLLPAWWRWWGRDYWRADVVSTNLKTVDLDPSTSSRPRRRAGHLRPRDDVDPAPSTITRTTPLFTTEVSPAWTPNALSPLPPNLLYIHVNVD